MQGIWPRPKAAAQRAKSDTCTRKTQRPIHHSNWDKEILISGNTVYRAQSQINLKQYGSQWSIPQGVRRTFFNIFCLYIDIFLWMKWTVFFSLFLALSHFSFLWPLRTKLSSLKAVSCYGVWNPNTGTISRHHSSKRSTHFHVVLWFGIELSLLQFSSTTLESSTRRSTFLTSRTVSTSHCIELE